MNSVVTVEFVDRLNRRPDSVRRQASRAYALWRADPHHPSLQFKRVSQRQPIYSVRVGLGHRTLGLWEGAAVTWFWIGTHGDDDTSWPDCNASMPLTAWQAVEVGRAGECSSFIG